jgi:hemerythrin-like metal-binding protein
MTVPEWDDSYSIGLPTFDSEHKLLMGRVEAICRACEAGGASDDVVALLDDLLNLFLRHIAWEERWMERLTTPAGIEHRNRHKAGHRELAARAMLLRERLAIGGDCRSALDDLGFFLTLFELIEFDFEMVGLLRREGVLTGANTDLFEDMLPDPLQIYSPMGLLHSPTSPPEPEALAEQKPEPA